MNLKIVDIKLEEGVEIPNLDDNSDQMVVNVAPPKAIVEDEPKCLMMKVWKLILMKER